MTNNKTSNTVTITATANGFAVDYSEFEKTIKAGNAALACDIACDIIGESALYNTLLPYLDAGCELVDLERDLTDGLIIINALRNGCNVGEATNEVTPDANPLDLFNALPNLYN